MKLDTLKITNFRTIESLELRFDSAYVAICGPNDSGKTNVLRAVRGFLRERDSRHLLRFDDEPDISLKSDFPKFSKTDAAARRIDVELGLTIYRQKDAGLFGFIERQLGLESLGAELALRIGVVHQTAEPTLRLRVEANDAPFEGIQAQEVLERVRRAGCFLFHNSTQTDSRTLFRPSGGDIRAMSPDQEHLVSQMKSTVNKGLNKLSKTHQEELEALLGRLSTRYRVGLSMPTFDFSSVPFRLTLGQKEFSVPLDDWGSGTVNRALVLLTLFRARQVGLSDPSASKVTPVIFLEEPESFLHPAAQAEFGRVLQDLAVEFDVQVIVTTHSPYLLNLRAPGANVLLNRKSHYKQLRETVRVDTSGPGWMEPFSQILGLNSDEFRPWRELIFSRSDALLLVEGQVDKEYLEMLRDPAHGTHQLKFEGEIVAYDGTGNLANGVLLRFIRNRHSKLFVTYDLDAQGHVEKHLTALKLERGAHYAPVGEGKPGRRCIEGLLPDAVTTAVHASHSELVRQTTFGTKEEQDRAKRELKRQFLEEFKRSAKPGVEHFGGFYPLVRVINKALG